VGDLRDPLRDAEVSELAAGVTDGLDPTKGKGSQVVSDASDGARYPRDSDDPDRRTIIEA